MKQTIILILLSFILNTAFASPIYKLMKQRSNSLQAFEVQEKSKSVFELNSDVFDFRPVEKTRIVELELPDGETVRAVLHKEGNLFKGAIEGVDESSITFIRRGKIITGNIEIENRNFEIRYEGVKGLRRLHKISEVDYSSMEINDDEVDQGNQDGIPISELPDSFQIEDIPVIDVLVAYTASARSAAGGTTSMKNLIDLAISQANEAYTNSQINLKINLVGTIETTYVESGDQHTDLARLQTLNDGFLEDVTTAREQYHADLVSLIVNKDSSACGTGYILTSMNSTSPSWGFSVVYRTCAAGSGSYSLTHEMGHNMGAMHAQPEASYPGIYSDSYGYRFYGTNGAQYRTVMAYSPGTRIKYFSNPNVLYQGAATGSVDKANNARALNATATFISNYRGGSAPAPAPAPTPTPTPTPAPTPSIPQINISDISATEGNTSSVVMKFDVRLSTSYPSDIKVNYTTIDGTAIAGSDYTAKTGTLIFYKGETYHTIQISVTPDKIKEATETFTVKLSNPVNATLGRDTAIGTILDTD